MLFCLTVALTLLCAVDAQPSTPASDPPLEPDSVITGSLPDSVRVVTRAEAHRQARRDRLDELEPVEQGALERRLIAFEESGGPARLRRLLRGPVRPAFGGAGVGAKLAAGASVHAFPHSPHRRLSARVVASPQGTVVGRATAGFRTGPLTLYAAGTAGRLGGERFYGYGMDTPEGSRTDFVLRETEATAFVGWRPARRVVLAAIGGWARYSPDESPALSGLPAAGDDQQFATGGLRLVLEGRDVSDGEVLGEGLEAAKRERANRVLDPTEGAFLAVQAERFHGAGGGVSFTQYTAEAQGYLDLRRAYNVIALRAAATYADPDDGDEVPFYLLPPLGGPYTLRGFDAFRFRDRTALALSAEYRWRVWRALDFALLADAGQVAHRPQDFSLAELEYSFGGGARLVTPDGIFFRIDIARSEEGTRLIVRFDHAF